MKVIRLELIGNGWLVSTNSSTPTHYPTGDEALDAAKKIMKEME